MTVTYYKTFILDIEEGVFEAEVKITGEYEPGVHTFSNGDPGYPSSEERHWSMISVVLIDNEMNRIIIYPTHPDYDAVCDEVDNLLEREEIDYD